MKALIKTCMIALLAGIVLTLFVNATLTGNSITIFGSEVSLTTDSVYSDDVSHWDTVYNMTTYRRVWREEVTPAEMDSILTILTDYLTIPSSYSSHIPMLYSFYTDHSNNSDVEVISLSNTLALSIFLYEPYDTTCTHLYFKKDGNNFVENIAMRAELSTISNLTFDLLHYSSFCNESEDDNSSLFIIKANQEPITLQVQKMMLS